MCAEQPSCESTFDETQKRPDSGLSHNDIKECASHTYTKITIKHVKNIKRYQTKTPLYVWIPKEVDEELRRTIVQKYGEFRRGLLSLEVTLALRAWLVFTHRHIPTQMPSLQAPRSYRVWLEIRDYIERRFNVKLEDGRRYPLTLLQKAITAVRGGDRRTLKRWLSEFAQLGFIELKTGGFWELGPEDLFVEIRRERGDV